MDIIKINEKINKYILNFDKEIYVESVNMNLWIENFNRDFDLRWKRHYSYYLDK